MAILGTLCDGFSCSSIFSSYLWIFTTDVTGSLWLSLFAIFLLIYVIALYAGMPNTLALMLLVIYVIFGSLLTNNWYPFLGLIAAFTAFLVARNLF